VPREQAERDATSRAVRWRTRGRRFRDRLTAQARFVGAVQEGLGDLDAGRVIRDDDLGRRLDARFGPLSKSKK